MSFCYPDPTGMHEPKTPIWKLVYSIESADGSSVREYQAKSPEPGRMFQMRVCEDDSGSSGSYSITR